MEIEEELKRALNDESMRRLLDEATTSSTLAVIERDLLRRRPAIEFELSAATDAVNKATADLSAAEELVEHKTSAVAQRRMRALSYSTLLTLFLFAMLGVIFDLSLARDWLNSASAPLSSGWLALSIWLALAVSVPLAVYCTVFFGWLLPRQVVEAQRDANVTGLKTALREARSHRNDDLAQIVVNHVTEIANLARGPMWSATIRVRASVRQAQRGQVTLGIGLSEVANDDNRVATDVQQRLLHLVTSLPGASIGISGPRGAGKSSLLATLCGTNPTISGRKAIAINTAAPVEYDGREFLLHIFARLCRQVLRAEGRDSVDHEHERALDESEQWRRRTLRAALPNKGRLLTIVGAAMIVFATLLGAGQAWVGVLGARLERARVLADNAELRERDDKDRATAIAKFKPGAPPATLLARTTPLPLPGVPDPALEFVKSLLASPLFILGAAAFVLGFYVRFGARRIADQLYPGRYSAFGSGSVGFDGLGYRRSHNLVESAIHELRNISFQRTFTSGWSGTLKVPVGFDGGSSGGLSLAERTQALPDLVDRFRAFVSLVAETYDNVVLIGIDELDKLKNAQQAEAFLNGVKSVFGIERCFFLISVSENALAAFERRGLGFRDAFDSALDDIVQVDFLTLDQSRALLNRRILRLPDPFLQLCHMLSGGLPRDLIRHARALMTLAEEEPSGHIKLSAAVLALTKDDLAARIRATSIQIRMASQLP